MGFTVDLRALASLPPLLERRAAEVEAGAAYLGRYAVIQDTGRLAALDPLRQAHEDLLPHLGTALVGYADTLNGRAAAVRAAIRSYAECDQASRAALDALAGQAGHHGRLPGPLDYSPGPRTFDDSWVVADYLAFPDTREEYPATPVPDSWLAPARHLVLRPLRGLGYPVSDRLTEVEARARRLARPLCGDWPGVHACVFSFDALGEALTAVAENLTGTAKALGRIWTGNAAATCATALVADSGRSRQISATLHDLSAAYRPAGQRAWDAARAVGSALAAGIDANIPGLLGPDTLVVNAVSLTGHGATAQRRLVRARQAAREAATTAQTLLNGLAGTT
jgi:hypothetical protein